MTDKNIQTVLAYVEAMNAGDLDALQALFTADALVCGVASSGPVEAVKGVWHDLHHGLNMHLKVESIVAHGDLVAVRYTERGRWTGPFLGYTNPTGRAYELVAMEWFELKDGLIRRRWGARDSATQARQVGFDTATKAA